MRKILTLLIALVALTATAQITAPAVEEKPETDLHYLAGAVPEVNGRVVLNRTIELPADMKVADAMTRIDAWLTRCAKDARVQYEQRLPQPNDHQQLQSYSLELTFTKNFLAHDFSINSYVLSCTVSEGKVLM